MKEINNETYAFEIIHIHFLEKTNIKNNIKIKLISDNIILENVFNYASFD